MRDDKLGAIVWQMHEVKKEDIGYHKVINFDVNHPSARCPLVIKKIKEYEANVNEILKLNPVMDCESKEFIGEIISQVKRFIGGTR